MKVKYKKLLAVCAVGALLAGVSACGGSPAGSASGSSSGPIVLGTSLSLSGQLGQTGVDQQAGYQEAVNEINAQGGLMVGGKRRQVKLEVLDNRSDPNTSSQQVRQLIDNDGAAAILGACTATIVIPEALVAEQRKVPYVTSCDPTHSFSSGNPAGWKYSWDLFFNETDQANAVAKVLTSESTNRKVALFTDTEPDGVAERPLYKAAFAAAGLDVVGDYTFPVGTTDFSSFINDAKSKGAQLLAAQMIPPDGITLWKQMKALDFKPKLAFVSKAAANTTWPSSLGAIANGTLTDGLWDLTQNPTASQQILNGPLGKKYANDFSDLTIAVISYTAAQVTLDAITRAGATEGTALNTAIGETNGNYALGHIQFDAQHTDSTPYVVDQWQNGVMRQVLPPSTGVTLQFPTSGLQ